MKIIFSNRCLEYEFPGHPESVQRVKSIHALLKEKNFDFIQPDPAETGDILRVHSKDLVESVKRNAYLDPDTPNAEKMFEYALLSCGAAIKAQELALDNETAFSLMRPPGHHATKDRAGGFCYFNNIAVAVSKALDAVKKVAIIDIDCHHGNGTQDIFLGDERVFYVSLHQSPLYPGTGLKSVKNCLNFALPAGTKEGLYLEALKEALIQVKTFKPQLIAVSAGFDTYKNDPLTDFGLEETSYAKISGLISALKMPRFFVLEGGYSLEIASCVLQFLQEDFLPNSFG